MNDQERKELINRREQLVRDIKYLDNLAKRTIAKDVFYKQCGRIGDGRMTCEYYRIQSLKSAYEKDLHDVEVMLFENNCK